MMMFSDELRQLDRNTSKFMIDELHDELEQTSVKLKQLSTTMKQMAIAMFEAGFSLEDISKTSNTDIKTIQSWINEKQ